MSTENTFLALPVSNRELSDFILKLLGRGRIIRKDIRRPFVIDAQGLHSLHAGIDQRVTRQNRGALSSFEIEVEFEDGHTYTIVSIGEFARHNFTENQRCVRARINWTYLVEFMGRPPEKQLIEIMFSTQQRLAVGKASQRIESSFISLQVEHTEVTWGYDLFRHIEHFIDAYVIYKTDRLEFARNLLKSNREIIFGACGMIAAIWASFRLHGGPLDLASLSAYSDFKRMEAKIDHLIMKDQSFSPALFMLTVLAIFAMTVTALWFAGRVLEAFDESAIFLNDNMKKMHDAARGRHLQSRCVALLGFVGASLAGIFHHFLYDISGIARLFGLH